MASPVFKTGVTRLRRVGWVRFPHAPAMAFASLALIIAPCCLEAQQQEPPQVRPPKLDRVTECLPVPQDTSRAVQVPSVILGPVAPKSGPPPCKVPISPGSAFVRSALIPGLAQLKLGRPKAATIFIIGEVGTVGMSAKSWFDLKKAKDARKDTIMVVATDESGQPIVDPVSGDTTYTSVPKNPNLVGRIRARRTHLEDWVAAAIFNHLFAGADAYVAAHLADFNTNVQADYSDGRLKVLARVSW